MSPTSPAPRGDRSRFGGRVRWLLVGSRHRRRWRFDRDTETLGQRQRLVFGFALDNREPSHHAEPFRLPEREHGADTVDGDVGLGTQLEGTS